MSNNSSFGVGFWLFMVLAAAIAIGSMLSSDTSVEQYAPEIDDNEYAPPVKAKPKPKRKPRPARTTSAPSPSSYWSGSSNGYNWTQATYAQKKWICDKMSGQAGTSSYWMNFFNNFYGSPATNSTSMSDASKLAEVGL
jgi:hypothetical protein